MNKEQIKEFSNYLLSQNIDCGDADSMLSMIFNKYMEYNHPFDKNIQEEFRCIYRKLNGKSMDEIEMVTDAVSNLCFDYEQAGFVAGLKLGMRLADEINH